MSCTDPDRILIILSEEESKIGGWEGKTSSPSAKSGYGRVGAYRANESSAAAVAFPDLNCEERTRTQSLRSSRGLKLASLTVSFPPARSISEAPKINRVLYCPLEIYSHCLFFLPLGVDTAWNFASCRCRPVPSTCGLTRRTNTRLRFRRSPHLALFHWEQRLPDPPSGDFVSYAARSLLIPLLSSSPIVDFAWLGSLPRPWLGAEGMSAPGVMGLLTAGIPRGRSTPCKVGTE